MSEQITEKTTNAHRIGRMHWAVVCILLVVGALPIVAQDDITTHNASSALDGAWITGPASNPLSRLNGPAFQTGALTEPYDFQDFAPVNYLDDSMPRWISLRLSERYRYEAFNNSSFKAEDDDSYELNRFRLETDLRPGSWFRLSAQVQDARPFFKNPPIGPPDEVRWDLKLAYAEIGDPEKHWFSLRVGRQIINYNNTLISGSEWRNQGRAFDAAALNLQSRRARLGIFAASVVVPQDSGVSPHQEGNNIYGLYGRLLNLAPHSSLEAFVLWRVQPEEVMQAALARTTGKEDERAYGVRMKGRASEPLDYSGELVVENGTVGAYPIRAWAFDYGVSYQFREAHGQPRFFAQHDFASGNSNPADGVHRTFDTMYPEAHDRFGTLDLFGWQNMQSVRAGGTVMPHRRLSVSGQALDFWAVSALDAVYNTSGEAIAANKMANGRHIGQEFDVYTWYELNRHLNIGAGYGWFGGGDFLSHIVGSHAYSSSYVVLDFKNRGQQREK
jgi:Alginate export